ncbi:serine/threonine protein kinase [Embleya sp. NPDC050493]|uniref:serine/threonine protein kinase n=1 Tax=Embleya sp. NPDC050493 TaxID=3363989 RepID=UPI00379A0856
MTADGGAEIRSLRPGDPQHIGPFRITGRLGAGGMGAVYAGLDGYERRVAVKVVHAQYADDPEFRARFTREVNLLRAIKGTCTTPVLDADVDAETPWFATEYVPGPTLDVRVNQGGPMHGDELMGLAAGLAEALVALHDADVIHRDLKPQNIICSPAGPRVLDLGIARSMEDSGLTRTGMMIGSPAWMSPERFKGHDSTPAADVYAWAMLITYAATGVIPFGTGAPEVVALRVLQEEADLSGVPDVLRLIVKRASDKEPHYRPHARELLASVTHVWRGALGNAAAPSLDPVADATSLIGQLWTTPASGGAWQVQQNQQQQAPQPPQPRVYEPPRGPARSGGTAAFGAPSVSPQTPPPAGGRPSHDPYGASQTQPPLYRDAPTSGTHGVPPQPSGQYGAASGTHGVPPQSSGQFGAPSGRYGAPSGQYGAPSGQYGTAGQGYSTNPHEAPTAHGAHTPPPTGRAAARQGGSGGGTGRKRVLLAVGGVAAVLVIGVGAVFALRGGDDDKDKKKPETQKTPTAEIPRLTGKTGGFTQDIKGMKFAVPATWELKQVSETEVCVLPSATPAAQRTTCERAGLRIWVGKNSERKVDFKDQAGWTLGAKPTCVTRADDAVAPTSKSDGKKYVEPGKGSLTFEYASYSVSCKSGDSFQPQLWWLPQSMISFSTAGLSREYDTDLNKILASVSVTGYKKPAA